MTDLNEMKIERYAIQPCLDEWNRTVEGFALRLQKVNVHALVTMSEDLDAADEHDAAFLVLRAAAAIDTDDADVLARVRDAVDVRHQWIAWHRGRSTGSPEWWTSDDVVSAHKDLLNAVNHRIQCARGDESPHT